MLFALLYGPLFFLIWQFSLVLGTKIDENNVFMVHLDPKSDPYSTADAIGAVYVRPMRNLENHHLFTLNINDSSKTTLKKRNAELGVLDFEQQIPRWRYKREEPTDSTKLLEDFRDHFHLNDPLLSEQWHILNYEKPGHDLNLREVWDAGILGENVTVAFVDDGIDFRHPDLQAAYTSLGSWDFNDNMADPLPKLSDDLHGTRCAGEVAASWNDVCGVGIAPKAKVAGVRILSAPINDVVESEALNYGFQTNHIYSCSWGPADDGRAMEAPRLGTRRALVNGVINGRNGLGSVFVFASGNGGHYRDNCNFDGYTNSIFSVTVGAVDIEHQVPFYSELCAAQLVSAYSSGSHHSIATTNPEGTCTKSHGGTSAAAPLASAVYALALSIRPDLTWRDIQHITVHSAIPFDSPSNVEWTKTPAGFKFSHKFGFGKLDAKRFIETASDWQLVNPQTWLVSPQIVVDKSINKAENLSDSELISEYVVTEEMIEKSNFKGVEQITIKVSIPFTCRGAMTIELESPAGIRSMLASLRPYDQNNEGFPEWTFMTVQHWSEPILGSWKLIVRDHSNGCSGRFNYWQLAFWGESRDPSLTIAIPYDTLNLPSEGALGTFTEKQPNSTSTTPIPLSTSFTSHIVSPTATSTTSSPFTVPSFTPFIPTVLETSYREMLAFTMFFLLLAFVLLSVIWVWICSFFNLSPVPMPAQEIPDV
ncbi:kexin [Schizosaccharomyces cryophilus OY26]|uniref:Kexin n=1 Tax=Schizosaccharomyces cryophilus (strain OY26 / ATCC MYA-4695 / CBS 11777 / NBRC 106824 / NRRL Y48691) TaxID=653667 RepID=S9XG31_SCHCR|nr:kexin [Schizosaccharomyces cryophilus OY26]EPY52611.1 kexin [Schizosaccharomyces cryophilus OY26]